MKNKYIVSGEKIVRVPVVMEVEGESGDDAFLRANLASNSEWTPTLEEVKTEVNILTIDLKDNGSQLEFNFDDNFSS